MVIAVPLFMALSAAIGLALVTRPNKGLETVQSMVIATTLLQAENSGAAPIGARWERSPVGSSAPGTEPLQPTYTGPTFLSLIHI